MEALLLVVVAVAVVALLALLLGPSIYAASRSPRGEAKHRRAMTSEAHWVGRAVEKMPLHGKTPPRRDD